MSGIQFYRWAMMLPGVVFLLGAIGAVFFSAKVFVQDIEASVSR